MSLRVTRDRCRLVVVVVTWDAKKKTKRENKILFLRSFPPSLRRRRDVTRVKVWLTTELTIDVTAEVRILRPST